MNITLLCNAGVALECDGETLLVDLPNCDLPPYYPLPDSVWNQIMEGEKPYDHVCGIFFTHDHPDHMQKEKLEAYRLTHPEVPIFAPDFCNQAGVLEMGPFRIRWALMPHAPLPWPLPAHAVAWIEAEGECLYIASDAALDVSAHDSFLRAQKADIAIWNAMYLSRTETRELMHRTADRNYIYHMPADYDDELGMWRKCRANLRRYPDELKGVIIMDRYPYRI
jgi:glyoxylase-like metal-dependent hydrolase (beta-lactamase superfamily II)